LHRTAAAVADSRVQAPRAAAAGELGCSASVKRTSIVVVPAETLLAWLERLPKVELHLHLEGAIPHPVLCELLQKDGGYAEVPTCEALGAKFAYRDFPHFLEMWTWKNGLLREYEDFTFVAAAVARDLARQNIRYAEVFYSPADFQGGGLEVQR